MLQFFRNSRLTLLFYVSTCSILSAQNNYIEYYNQVGYAEEAFCEMNFIKSQEFFEDAFQIAHPMFRDIINYSRCLLINKSCPIDSIREMLLSFADTRGPYLSFQYRDDEILKKLDSADFFDQLKQAEKAREIDFETLQMVNLLIDLDQFARENAQSGCGIALVDSFIEVQILKIIETKGYPGYKLIGTDIASILLVHMVNSENYDKIKAILLQEVQKGNLLPIHFGYFLDRKFEQNGECGLNLLYTKTKQQCIGVVESIIIERRKQIGIIDLSPRYHRTYKLHCDN